MRQSFGHQLKNFALAVDILDKEIYLAIKDLILDYTRQVLDIDFTRQLIEADLGDGNPALMPFGLATKGKYKVISVYDSEMNPNTQAAYCYLKNQPLWIVNGESVDSPLMKCSSYKDLWKNASNIPPYRYPSGERENVPIKTTILIPLRHQGRAFGVLNFETQDHLVITEEAKSELRYIVDAVAILYQGYLSYEENFNRTREAFSHLNDILNQPLPKLTKPKIFLASSTRAKADVIEVLIEVLDEYKDRLDVVYWKNMQYPGNINAQLLRILGKCRYGICYISEPDEKENVFRDNPNVIFEAGMLHGRCDGHLEFPASWIPVREENSETVPFDFSSERTVIVERDQDRAFDATALKQTITESINALINN